MRIPTQFRCKGTFFYPNKQTQPTILINLTPKKRIKYKIILYLTNNFNHTGTYNVGVQPQKSANIFKILSASFYLYKIILNPQ